MLTEKGCFNDLIRCSLNYSVEACDDLLLGYNLSFCRFFHGDKIVQTADIESRSVLSDLPLLQISSSFTGGWSVAISWDRGVSML